MAANPNLETGQPTYDSEFLKSIRTAPASTGPELAPGERKVICSVAEAQPTGLRERLFSSSPERAMLLWGRVNVRAAEFGETHLLDNYLRVRFEDLCAKPVETTDGR